MSNMSDKELKALLISQYIVIINSIAVIGIFVLWMIISVVTIHLIVRYQDK